MTQRAHRLFGLAAKRWEITPGYVALAEHARHNGLAASTHPLMLGVAAGSTAQHGRTAALKITRQ
jgi:hypothetical protein